MAGKKEKKGELTPIGIPTKPKPVFFVANIGINNLLTGKKDGHLDVLIGAWDGNNWVTKPKASLTIGQTCNLGLSSVKEWVPNSGEYLLIRPNGTSVCYSIDNFTSTSYARYARVNSQVFPFWQGTKVITESTLPPKSTKTFFFTEEQQDVVNFFAIG